MPHRRNPIQVIQYNKSTKVVVVAISSTIYQCESQKSEENVHMEVCVVRQTITTLYRDIESKPQSLTKKTIECKRDKSRMNRNTIEKFNIFNARLPPFL